MLVPNKLSYMSVEAYLESEERSSVRREYVDGQVFAMSGATNRHRTIAGNIYSALRLHVQGSRCGVDMSDAKVQVKATNSFYYPDISLSCGAYDDNSVLAVAPVLIVEALSRSTVAIDCREKLFAYRKTDSLKEYMIVHQRKQKVELHRKNEGGLWDVFEFEQGEVVLKSTPLGLLKLPLDTIYEGVQWQPGNDWKVREEAAAEWQEDEDILDW